jgi:hypothetical protein
MTSVTSGAGTAHSSGAPETWALLQTTGGNDRIEHCFYAKIVIYHIFPKYNMKINVSDTEQIKTF